MVVVNAHIDDAFNAPSLNSVHQYHGWLTPDGFSVVNGFGNGRDIMAVDNGCVPTKGFPLSLKIPQRTDIAYFAVDLFIVAG